MKIAIICHPSLGGSGMVATQLGIGLAQKGHEVHFIAETMPFKLQGLATLLPNIYFHSTDKVEYPLFNDKLTTFSLTAKIVEVAEAHKLDIVHAHYSVPHSLCSHLARQISSHSFHTVTTIHGTDVTIAGQSKPLFPLNKFSIEQSSLVTTVSQYQADYVNTHFAPNKPIRVIHNFIDSNVFTSKNKQQANRQMLADTDEKIIIHMSNFRPVKNTEGVIKSFALAAEKTNAKLVLIGDGPNISAVKNLVEKLNLVNRVKFMGKILGIEKYIANADVVFQPSYHESFGMVALEAMSSAVPVVSSNVDGIPEVVEHHKTGLLAAPDDHASHAEHLIQLCNNDLFAMKIGQAGRKRAQSLFDWDIKVSEYEACYLSLLNQ